MNRNEIIADLKAIVNKMFSNEIVPEKKFSDYILSDKTKLTSPDSDLQIGSEIYKVDDLGNQTPCDDGDYVLDDGRTISIKGSKITDIKGGDTTTAESPVAEGTDNAATKQADTNMDNAPVAETAPVDDDSDILKRVSDLESQMNEILSLLSNMSGSQSKMNEQLMSSIKSFGAEPGETSIKPLAVNNQAYSKDKVKSKINMEEILELRKLIAEKNKVNLY